MKRLPSFLYIPLAFALVKIILHLSTANSLGFHRDEFLYLALGRHLDWGFWSNPPFVGFVGWFSQNFFGDSLFATRLLPALCGGGLLLLTGLMVRDLGGGRFAQILCGAAMLFSIAWLRTYSMLQPVPFDVFFWALLSFFLLKWLKTNDSRWWWFIGAAAGIGFLNKYTLAIWAVALLVALLVVPQRKVLVTRAPWLAVGLALLIVTPNLSWQWQYNFPVIHHMEQLSRYQLRNVQPVNFLLDQLLMQGFGGAIVWVPGLFFLLSSKTMQPYRLLFWFYVALLLIFLFLSGKSYYTLGAYPVLLAAGAVFWEKILKKTWQKAALTGVVVALALPLVPVGIPLYSGEKAVAYFHWLTYDAGIDAAVRWEDGELHQLPQDFADMLGWDEIAHLVDAAAAQTSTPYMVYGENYGEAGAASHLSEAIPPIHGGGRGEAVSFSDSWLLWAPDSISPDLQTLIYINDGDPGKDVQVLFADVRLIGRVENPLARERGTGVWLCQNPRSDVAAFWTERVKQVKAVLKPSS